MIGRGAFGKKETRVVRIKTIPYFALILETSTFFAPSKRPLRNRKDCFDGA